MLSTCIRIGSFVGNVVSFYTLYLVTSSYSRSSWSSHFLILGRLSRDLTVYLKWDRVSSGKPEKIALVSELFLKFHETLTVLSRR